MKKTHVLCQGTNNFGITRHLQILMCFLGQSKVFEEASEIFLQLIGLEMSGMQIQRVSEYYGKQLDPAVERNIEVCIPKLAEVEPDDTVYVMTDGSMLYTTEDWKEMKLARIFAQDSIAQLSEKRREIRSSVYVSHMGGVDTFLPKLERHLCDYKRKVFIGDGAKWIWNWVEDNYPGATQILDFYHAHEKLVILSKLVSQKGQKKWIESQCEKLLDDKVYEVISNIGKIRCTTDEQRELKAKIINYYEEHEDRMLYKTYRDRGLLIGSGPIEAAHRSVLQSRMKLSGQKWSIKGVNAIANLRCLKMSNAWNVVEAFVKAAA